MPTFVGEESRKFDPLPDGDYDLMITKINEDVAGEKAKNPGADMWRVQYDIMGLASKRKVFDNLVFVKSSYWKICNFMRALGIEIEPNKEMDTGEPSEYIGRTLRAHLTTREYNGDKQNEIFNFIEPEHVPGSALTMAPRPSDAEPDEIPF